MRYVYFIILIILATSCDDTSNEETTINGAIQLQFDHIVNDQPLILNNQTYRNAAGESYSVSNLTYIISNISFHKSNGDRHIVPIEKSYFVIAQDGIQQTTAIEVPAGDYTGVTFGIGVDPSKYPIASGSLNFIPMAEEAGMLWTWSAGYKFLKFEGNYGSQEDASLDNTFTYHVGSHGSNLDNYKEVTLALNVSIVENTTETIDIKLAVDKIFDSTFNLSLAAKNDIQVDPVNAPKVAENLRTAFSISP